MRTRVKIGVLAALVLLSASACTRRVQVESEPNEPEYRESSMAPAETPGTRLT